MSGSAVSVVALTVLLIAGVALECSARRRDDRATLAQALGAALRTTPGRACLFAVWLWLGIHFLAR